MISFTDLEESSIFDNNDETEESDSTSIYLSTLIDSKVEGKQESLKSLLYPRTWPNSANLLKDSDVYPCDAKSIDIKDELTLTSSEEPHKQRFTLGSRKSLRFLQEEEPEEEEEYREYGEEQEVTSSILEKETLESSVESVGSFSSTHSFPDYSIETLNDILSLPMDETILKRIEFAEKLVISFCISGPCFGQPKEDDDGINIMQKLLSIESVAEEVGTIFINISAVNDRITAYSCSKFTYKGGEANTGLISVIDTNFQLFEEKKTERISKLDSVHEKSIHVFRENDHFVTLRSETNKNINKNRRQVINLDVTGDFILDGGSLILMRYLVRTRFNGQFKTWTIHISGEVCLTIYDVSKRNPTELLNRKYETITIVKQVCRKTHKPIVSKTIFLPNGQMVCHQWDQCPYYVHISVGVDGKLKRCHIESLETNWKNDIVLNSRYLDYKAQQQSEIQTYRNDNNEFETIMKDYLFHVLQYKPNNVLGFTVDYFKAIFDRE